MYIDVYTYSYYSISILTYMYMYTNVHISNMPHHPLQQALCISVGILALFKNTESTRRHHKCMLIEIWREAHVHVRIQLVQYVHTDIHVYIHVRVSDDTTSTMAWCFFLLPTPAGTTTKWISLEIWREAHIHVRTCILSAY